MRFDIKSLVIGILGTLVAVMAIGAEKESPTGPRWEYGELQHRTFEEGTRFRESSKWVVATGTVEGTSMGNLLVKLGGQPKDAAAIWMFNFLGSQGWEYVSRDKMDVNLTKDASHDVTLFKRQVH